MSYEVFIGGNPHFLIYTISEKYLHSVCYNEITMSEIFKHSKLNKERTK